METNATAYLGTSLKFPLEITPQGGVALVSGVDNIRQSVILILSEHLGTRFFLGQFGSVLNDLAYLPNDKVLQNLIKGQVAEVLKKFEPRIVVQDIVTTTVDFSRLDIGISYQIKNSQIADTAVFPFFRELNF